MSELTRRTLFALVAAPAALAIVYVGGAPLATLLAVVAALGAWEFFRIARAAGSAPMAPAGIALAAAVPLLAHAHVLRVFTLPADAAAVGVLALLGAAIWARGVAGRPLTAVATTAFGVLYTGGMLAFGYALRYHPYTTGAASGTALIGLPVALTWATDIGAYAVGRTLRGPKLIPAVSPGKTISGSVGGLLVTVLVCWVYVRFVLRPYAQLGMAPLSIVAFAVVVSVAAQIGDLAESLLKREAGVKDSSHIIPGHGGILDRFDSLFFVLPVAHLLLGRMLLPAPA